MSKENAASCTTLNEDTLCVCPLEGTIELISKKWTLQIVAAIGNHRKLRFNEIQTKLKGISPKSLTDRLKDLEKANLAERVVFAEIPPRVEYSLTRQGEELRRAIMPLMKWASTRNKSS